MTASKRALSASAFGTLLLIAFMMGANHVAARLAFNNGVDVATAVAFRSAVTTLVVAAVVLFYGVPIALTANHKKFLPVIGGLIGLQSLCLYSSVARLPVALALLAFNTYPLWAALWDRVLYGHRTEPAVLKAMPVLLLGLAMALDVFGAASGLGATAHWSQIGAGVAFGVAAAASFGLAMILTQHEAGDLDGRVRTVSTLGISGLIALSVVGLQGGFHLPTNSATMSANAGWLGLALLTFLYGTAFTIMFTVLPKLGVAGSSPIMNVEPVVALVLAWALLGQSIAAIQVAGALIVVGAVMWLGLRKK
jgi:drug/metabolite transporter (DMT)-like permease